MTAAVNRVGSGACRRADATTDRHRAVTDGDRSRGDGGLQPAEHRVQRLLPPGVEHEVVTYEGAPHSFFDRRQAEHQAASDDAWARVIHFIDAHS